MSQSLIELVCNTRVMCLVLIKVLLLAKYFVFMRHKSDEWKAVHMIYFPQNEIDLSPDLQGAKAKMVQNHLSINIVLLALLAALCSDWFA